MNQAKETKMLKSYSQFNNMPSQGWFISHNLPCLGIYRVEKVTALSSESTEQTGRKRQ